MVCAGPRARGPTALLEAGAFGFAADWAAVQAKLEAQGVRSCAYDRAGMGYSDPAPGPRDGLAGAEDLEKLLAVSHESGPYILVGHSMAGLRVTLFARRNPDKVAGVVLVDATTPELSATPSGRAFLEPFSQVSRFAAWAASAGVLKPVAPIAADTIGLPPEAQAEKRWAFADARHNRTSAQEVEQWTRMAEEASQAGPLDPDVPVAVITAGRHRPDRLDLQTAPARRSRHGYAAAVEGANHASLLGRQYCDAIVKAIDFVRAAATQQASSKGAAQAAG
jgi:pimeloyl-ACP methyl ester carboxylesterase